MKIVAFSDTHGVRPLPIVDPCDVVIIAGDFIPLEVQRNSRKSKQWFKNVFLEWAKDLQCEKIILVGGNHDFFLDWSGKEKIKSIISEAGLEDKVIYLQDELYEYKGKTFYGTPCCEGPRGWAFVPTDTQVYYEKIPNCDVLITHQPPRVEKVGCSFPGTMWEENWGSEKLRLAMIDKDIKINICGHIHTGTHGGVQDGYYDRKIYNVSILDEQYKIQYQLTEIEL